ncbi:MAG: hypothetical protein QOJ15_3183 [Bradyrhizobium sp.]|jgi:hypothetical protein|nr:hypothetical protein [Bradyrhizobium sp.]
MIPVIADGDVDPEAIAAALARIPSLEDLLKTKDGKTVSGRLKNSPEAMAALHAIASPSDRGALILRACIEAEYLKRTFAVKITAARAMRGKLDGLAVALQDLRSFVEEIAAGPDRDDPIPYSIIVYEAEIAAVKQSFDKVDRWIAAIRGISNGTAPKLGATRKANQDRAAETAAIGWLASAVKGICGRPHFGHVSMLATAALKTAETVSIDRIRGALKTRESGSFGS